MAGPEITGYRTDPNATWEQHDNAGRWDIHGQHGQEVRLWLRQNEWPYHTVEVNDDNRDAVFRSLGYRPVYRERPFHAVPIPGTFNHRISCKRCMYEWHTCQLPHDSAARHDRAFHHDNERMTT